MGEVVEDHVGDINLVVVDVFVGSSFPSLKIIGITVNHYYHIYCSLT